MIARMLDTFWRTTAFPYREVFHDTEKSVERARVLVSASYAAWVVYSLALFRLAPNWKTPPADVLWPIEWMLRVDWQPAVHAVYLAGALLCLLAAALPGARTLRILAFLAVFEGQAIRYSYGKIDHASHAWAFALFLLIFLPGRARQADETQKRSYLEIIWGVQAITFAFYTIAGLQKLIATWEAAGKGPTVFHADALARHIAQLSVPGGANGLLSGFFLQHPALGQPLMLGALFLELTALAVAWRPRLHAAWAVGLITMHLGIGLTMNIWFDPMILFVGLWFTMSPFNTRPFCLRATLRDVPWLGPVFSSLYDRLRRAPGEIIVYYDGDCAMCNTVVKTLLRIGVPANLRFASQQGETWRRLVAAKPWLLGIDTIAVQSGGDTAPAIRIRSEAVLWLLAQLRFPWSLAALLLFVPLPLLNLGYRLVAHNRKRMPWLFGTDTCVLVPPTHRQHFLD